MLQEGYVSEGCTIGRSTEHPPPRDDPEAPGARGEKSIYQNLDPDVASSVRHTTVSALRDAPCHTLVNLRRHCRMGGDVCGEAYWDGGEIVAGPGPHLHLVVSGENPKAAERYLAVLSG